VTTRAAGAATGGHRAPLTRTRVLEAAVALADTEGLEALTMRRLGQDLGVEAMTLYHHVRNKDALLAGVVDLLFDELQAAAGPVDPDAIAVHGWRAVLRGRILRAREVMLRHPWLPRVLEDVTSISLGAARYHEGVLGTLVVGGFSYDLAHHALHALGSRALGFTQELFEPDDAAAEEAAALEMMAAAADQLPHLVAMMQVVAHEDGDGSLSWCDDQLEFEFGLDVVLDGLEHRLAAGG
jgi:AcrR family transcriptional regulator